MSIHRNDGYLSAKKFIPRKDRCDDKNIVFERRLCRINICPLFILFRTVGQCRGRISFISDFGNSEIKLYVIISLTEVKFPRRPYPGIIFRIWISIERVTSHRCSFASSSNLPNSKRWNATSVIKNGKFQFSGVTFRERFLDYFQKLCAIGRVHVLCSPVEGNRKKQWLKGITISCHDVKTTNNLFPSVSHPFEVTEKFLP